MKRRKLISVLLAATMMAAMFAGCGSDAASTDAKENADGADSTEAGGAHGHGCLSRHNAHQSR